MPHHFVQALGDSGGSVPVNMVLPKDGSYWGLASVNGVNVLKHEGKQGARGKHQLMRPRSTELT